MTKFDFIKLHNFSLSLIRSQKSPTCCGKATAGSPVCRVENKHIRRKDKKQVKTRMVRKKNREKEVHREQ